MKGRIISGLVIVAMFLSSIALATASEDAAKLAQLRKQLLITQAVSSSLKSTIKEINANIKYKAPYWGPSVLPESYSECITVELIIDPSTYSDNKVDALTTKIYKERKLQACLIHFIREVLDNNSEYFELDMPLFEVLNLYTSNYINDVTEILNNYELNISTPETCSNIEGEWKTQGRNGGWCDLRPDVENKCKNGNETWDPVKGRCTPSFNEWDPMDNMK